MWFRRDLRLDDNPALLAAADEGAVVPVFVVDPAFDEAGPVRSAYLHRALTALDESIRERSGTGLVIRHGDPTDEIPALAEETGATTVCVSRDATPYGRRRDAAVIDALAGSGRRLRGVGSPYAVDPGTVRRGDGGPYSVFTPFARSWRATGWDPPHPPPGGDVAWHGAGTPGIESDDLGPAPEPGCELPPVGERSARRRWGAFVADGGADDGSIRSALAAYDDLRDVPARRGTSRLSADLKWGTIHPRTLLADIGSGDAAAWGDGAATFSDELAWRDFYADVLLRRPDSAWRNLNPKLDGIELDTGAEAEERFGRWCRGETGFGIVDAGMRQLSSIGWMHNRVRMITASFLVKDLHLPWQWGARWFMRHLVDGDLASNNHGWQWAAGTGTDAAPYFRVFNPTRQQERFDPDGAYVARWAPEPVEPMLDHAVERAEALRRLAAATP
ncbi:cryptochrome/photolyase family protein [Ilumatobacter sp.]|uniref:cryptochrome/photolyase family protein n=1 Tax=Ilumatobacter sp. TaxID=1967498 RepID=UPI003B52C843